MSTGKHLSGRGLQNGDARRSVAEAPAEDEWADNATKIDSRIEDRSDWARPRDPAAVHHIEKMLEELLVDVPMSPIEDHRVATDERSLVTPPPEPALVRSGRPRAPA